jgi:hypothetical protein
MPEEVFIDFDIIEMVASNRANTGIARAKIIEPERSALRLFQVARALFKNYGSSLSLQNGRSHLVDERFNLWALQYVEYMVINIDRRRDAFL